MSTYTGTSFIRNHLLIGPYNRCMPRLVWRSQGVDCEPCYSSVCTSCETSRRVDLKTLDRLRKA